MDNLKNSPHLRWEQADSASREIWKKYDAEISAAIVDVHLAGPTVSLFELYHALSIARRLCEVEKSPHELIQNQKFGRFQLGASSEPNICNGWGEAIKAFVKKRLKTEAMCNKGLSFLYFNPQSQLCLQHASGPVLHRCDPVFQMLRSTENFFEYLENAARLHYELSNYPPILRGSAAVNSWIIDKIAQKNFKVTSSIRPELYDWTAFFESPEAYRGFYVITASVNYMRAIPSLDERDRDFYNSIRSLMKEDPNSPGVIEQRETAWLRIQQNVKEYLDDPEAPELTDLQKSALRSIADGRLIFTPASEEIRTLVDALKKETSELTLNRLTDLLGEANITNQRLKDLLLLNVTLKSRHLACAGNKAEEAALDNDWRDLEVLRELPDDSLSDLHELIDPEYEYESTKVYSYGFSCQKLEFDPRGLTPEDLKTKLNDQPSVVVFDEDIFYLGTDTDWRLVPLTYDEEMSNPFEGLTTQVGLSPCDDGAIDCLHGIPVLEDYLVRKHPKLYELAGLSFASFADIARIPKEIIELLTMECEAESTSLSSRLKQAISLGGIRLQELPGLTLKDIDVIASLEALDKYNRPPDFIRGPELLRSASALPERKRGCSIS